MRERKPRTDWRGKMPPEFVAIATLNRDCEIRWTAKEERGQARLAALAPDASPEDRRKVVEQYVAESEEFLAAMEREAADVARRFPVVAGNALAFSYLSFPRDRPFPEYLHWQRHGVSLESSIQRMRAGDVEALQQLHRTEEEVFRVAHGQGPIAGFQRNEPHRQLLELIICFEPQGSPLTEAERVECMDALCGCGNTHDAGAVRKQYARLRTELEAAHRASERGKTEIK
jgi:hypothetical protein